MADRIENTTDMPKYITDLPGMSDWGKYNGIDVEGVHYSPDQIAHDEGLIALTSDYPDPVYKSVDGGYTTKPYKAQSSITLDGTTGNIVISAPKAITELPEFKQTYPEDALKQYSQAYKLNQDYKVPYTEKDENGNEVSTEITIPDFVAKLNESLVSSDNGFLDNVRIAEEQRGRIRKDYGDKADKLSISQISKTLDFGKYVYIPKILLENQLKDLKSKVDDEGKISIEDFREAFYNRDKVGREELAGLLGSLDTTLKYSEWGDSTYEDEEGNTVENNISVDEMVKAMNLRNFLLSSDPDAEWYQQVGDNIVSFGVNAAYGCTRVFANIANLGEAVVTGGEGHGAQKYITDMDASVQQWNQENTLVNDATATLSWLGMIGGTILGTIGAAKLLSGVVSGVTKVASLPFVAAQGRAAQYAADAAAIANMGPSAQAALTAESMSSIMSSVNEISTGAQIMLKMASVAEKAQYAKGVYDAFMNSHQITSFAVSFLTDTVHDALLYDSVSLRQALEASDQETRDFWLGQLADNGKWWMGMAAAKGALKGAGKTNLGKTLNAYTTKYINKLAANVGDKKAAIKDSLAGGNLVRDLEDKLEDAIEKGQKNKANRIKTKIEQNQWNEVLRMARHDLGNIELHNQSLTKLTAESAENFAKAVDAVKAIENSIDNYNRNIFFKTREMLGLQKDPATGKMIYINPELGAANKTATDYYLKLSDLGAKYGLKTAGKESLISQEMIDYMVGSYHANILRAFVEANGKSADKAAKALEIVSKNVSDAKAALPDEIIKFIDENRSVYTNFYARLNGYGKAKGLVDVEKITGYEEHKIWAENGYMPIKVEKDFGGKWISEDGMVHAVIEQELRHHKFMEVEGQHYVDPELVRQVRISNMARGEINLGIMKAYSQIESATNVIKVSGEDSAYAQRVTAGRNALMSAIGDARNSFAESTPFVIRKSDGTKAKPEKGTPEYDQAIKEGAMSQFSYSDTQNILREKGLITDDAPYLTSSVTEEGFKNWYTSQTDSVKRYLEQQYDKYGFGIQTFEKRIADTTRAKLNTLVPGFDVTDTSMLSRSALNDLTGGKLYSDKFAEGKSRWIDASGTDTRAFVMPIDEVEKVLANGGHAPKRGKVDTILKETNTEGGYAPLSLKYNNGMLGPDFRWYDYTYTNDDYLGLLEHLKEQGVKDVPITITMSKGEISNDLAISKNVAERELRDILEKVTADGKIRDIDIETLAAAVNGGNSHKWYQKLRQAGYGDTEAMNLIDEAREYASTKFKNPSADDYIKKFFGDSSVSKGSVKDITDDLKKAFEEEPEFYIFHSQHKPLGSVEFNAEDTANRVDSNLGIGDALWISPNKSYVTGETPHGIRYGENLTIGKLPKDKLLTSVELENKVNELAKKFEELDKKFGNDYKSLTKAEQTEYNKLKKVFVSDWEKDDFLKEARQTLDDYDYKVLSLLSADNGYQARGFRPIAEYLGTPMIDTSEYMKNGKNINGSAFFYYKGADPKFDDDYAKQLKTQADAYPKLKPEEMISNISEKFPTVGDLYKWMAGQLPDSFGKRAFALGLKDNNDIDDVMQSLLNDDILSNDMYMLGSMLGSAQAFPGHPGTFSKDFLKKPLSQVLEDARKYENEHYGGTFDNETLSDVYRELGLKNEIPEGSAWSRIAPTADNIPTTNISDAEIRNRIQTFFKEDLKDVDTTNRPGGLTAKDFHSKENKAFLEKLGIEGRTKKGRVDRIDVPYGETSWYPNKDKWNKISIYVEQMNSMRELQSTELHEAAHAAWAVAGDEVRIRVGEDLLHKLGVDGKLSARLAKDTDMSELVSYACEAASSGDDLTKLSMSAQKHLDNIVKEIAPNAKKAEKLEWKQKIWNVVNTLATYIKGKIAGLIDAKTFDDFYNGLINGDFAAQLRLNTKYGVSDDYAKKILEDAQNWLDTNPKKSVTSDSVRSLLSSGYPDVVKATEISGWMTASKDASTANWNTYRGFTNTDDAVLPTPIESAIDNASAYKDFLSVVKAGGEDFEAGLQRAYLMGDADFMNSNTMKQAIAAQEDSTKTFYDTVINPEVQDELSKIKSIDSSEVAGTLTNAIQRDLEEYVNGVLKNENARKTIDAMADTTNGSALNARYFALKSLSDDPKMALKSLDSFIDSAVKGEGLTTDDVAKIKEIAHGMFDDMLETELSTARNSLKTIDSRLVGEDDVFERVSRINAEIKKSEDIINSKSKDSNLVMYLDNQGRSVYAETDPAFASLFNYRYRIDKGEASAMAKFNAATSKLFRYGTTSVNLASFGNQLFRDFGNALMVGGAWHTIKYNADNLVNVLGENVVEQIKRFDPSGYEMKQVEQIAAQNGMSIEQAAVSRELARGAAISPSTTERTLYKDFMKDAYASKDQLIKKAKTQLQSVIDKYNPEELLNGRRENYLRNRVFANTYNECISNGYTLEQARTFAEFAMNNATTNFSRQLYHMQAIADSTPYFRAAINGTKSFWRMWMLDPVGISGRIMGGLILPTIYLTGMSVADPQNREIYEKIPEYQKNNSLVFVINGTVMAIPIPQEMSAIVSPYRQFVEYLWGANKNDFWELMMNDALGYSPIDLQGFSTIDMNRMLGEPTIVDRISRGFSRVFSSVAPVGLKSLYILATKSDPYTGKNINDPSYSYWDDEKGEVVTMDYTQNEFAKWFAKSFGGKTGVSSALAEKLLGGIFGTTGANVLSDVTALLSGGAGSGLKETMTNIGTQLGKPFSVNVYDQSSSMWRQSVQALTAEKNEITNSDEWKALNSKLSQEKDPEKRKKILAERQNMVNDFQKKVMTVVKRLQSEYGGVYDKSKFAATIQLLNFASDPVYQSGSQYSSDIASDNYWDGRNDAIHTMHQLGIIGTNDMSIFGYLTTDKDGKPKVKYSDPVAILDATNAWKSAKDVHSANIEAAISTAGLWDAKKEMQKQVDAIYDKKKLSNSDYDAIDAIYVNWNANVMKTIAPYIEQMTPEAALNNLPVMNTLRGLFKVPGDYKKDKYGRYVTNKKLGEGNANDAYIESYIKKVFGVNDTGWASGKNYSGRKSLGE